MRSSTSAAVVTDRREGRWLVRVLAVMAAAACVLLFLVAGTRLLGNHAASGLPDRVHFEHRDYHRGRTEPLPEDAVESGRTSSGAVVYKPVGEVGLSVVIWVSDHDETSAYGLVGGP